MGRRATDIRAFFKKPDINEWRDVLPDGNVVTKSSVFCSNGIHLNDAGYELLVPYIQRTSATTCISVSR